ncbi:phage polarity suppression protein [Enterobacter sp.]
MTKWKIDVEAGRYIHSHEKVRRICIQHRLNDFMQTYSTELPLPLPLS